MNIVLVTCNYLPDTAPEAACASRFANALAKCGHHVTVIAWNRGGGVPEAVCEQIETENVTIIRIDEPCVKNRLLKLINRVLPFRLWSTIWNREMVNAVRSTLMATEAPVLISRSDPVMSTMVALRCRMHARKWVAHFSDVMPFGSFGRLGGILVWRMRRIVSRAFKASDAVAVTCDNAKRWFGEKYRLPEEFIANKFIVCTHIGDPLLQPESDFLPTIGDGAGKVVSHCGYLGTARYVDQISAALSEVARSQKMVFCLVGNFGTVTLEAFRRKGVNTISMSCDDPGKVTRINEHSDALIVADTNPKDVPYSPFLPSKFVYGLYTRTPIVACSSEDSEMFRISRLFPNAGIYWGDVISKSSIADAVRSALSRGAVSDEDRRAVREYFSEQRIIKNYLYDLDRLGVLKQ